ncbi:MAG: rhomboid family intramembrane serine protease [Myxococcales bacterium]|nr:rhomboid family intramembrane serine protease [Myxococcales bacterium]
MIPLRDINPTESRPVVTYVLLALNVVVYGYQASLSEVAFTELVHRYGMVPYYLTQDFRVDSLSTPLTSMFLHGSWLHLIFNMWFLFIFGDNVEDRLGVPRFLGFYLLCGMLAAAAQTLVAPESRVPMVGASGAIAGVLGAYFKLFPSARVVTVIPIFFFFMIRELPAVLFIVAWFIFQLLLGVSSIGRAGEGGVAFFAHIGGFLAGLWLLGLFMRGRDPDRGRRRIGPRQPPEGGLH